jgi:chlorite dismutase
VKERLSPRQPDDLPYVCFYPMDKRRNEGQNWYTLSLEERAALMRDHGATGRKFAGRISQVISGSIGFDDWEWAVTLFGRSPNDFKALVTEMRYDRVSAVYAEFGSFWVGYRVPTARIAVELLG